MNPFDGLAETASIVTRLTGVAEGGIFEGVPDDAQIPRDAMGATADYIIGLFGSPIPTGGNRQMAVGERKQPHILPVTIECNSATAAGAKALFASVMDLLLDFSPNGDNATPLKASGGYQYTSPTTQSRPTIFSKGCSFTTTINMDPNPS